MQLNTQQKAAVMHENGPAMVIAGPGSGKTAVITQRIYHLVHDLNLPPAEILVITFTRAAAEEMKSRYRELSPATADAVNFGTFHAVFYKILRISCHIQGNNVISPEKQNAVLREFLYAEEGPDAGLSERAGLILKEILTVKSRGNAPEEYEPENCSAALFARLYAAYGQYLREERLLDFEDMVVLCGKLFQKDEKALAFWQKRYKYILIDEFQDASPLQYRIARQLASPENNLFAVGDDDQSIYRFRGAEPEIMQHFTEDYPDAAVYPLSVCFRCSGPILRAAVNLVSRNSAHLPKELAAVSEEGEAPWLLAFNDRQTQNAALTDRIAHFHKAGLPYEEMAVLYRTGFPMGALASDLVKAGIPFVIREPVKDPYEMPAAQDIFAYLRLARGPLMRSDLLRIMNKPKRYLSRKAFPQERVNLADVRNYYADKPYMQPILDQLEYDLKVLSRMRPFAAIEYIRQEMGYNRFLTEAAEESGSLYRTASDETSGQAKEILAELDRLQEESAEFALLADWESHIKQVRAALSGRRERGLQEKGALPLLTMHGAKGLEFKAVFIPDLNEGVMPHPRAELDEDAEEERRLLYVAMTRASRYLWLSWCLKNRGSRMEPSRFLSELK